MKIQTFSGGIALLTSVIGLLPQIYKSYKTKSTNDVSMIMLLNYTVCSVSWIVYGICTSSVFVVLSNIVGAVTSLIAMFQKYKYDRRNC